MDFTWLVLFLVIAIVSSVMSKRAEQQAKQKRAQEDKDDNRTTRPTAPRSPGQPAAPGPFGAPHRVPRPPPPPPREDDDEDDDLFGRIRRDLEAQLHEDEDREQREREEAERERARKQALEEEQRRLTESIAAKSRAAARVLQETEPTFQRIDYDRSLSEPAVVQGRKRQRITPRTKAELRRAIVMKEILDKPKALRDERDPMEVF